MRFIKPWRNRPPTANPDTGESVVSAKRCGCFEILQLSGSVHCFLSHYRARTL